jgi:hypothetical protein
MKTTHPAFWGAGWAVMGLGASLTLFGLTSLSEVAEVAGAYGLMLMGTALFLLASLKLRERLLERAESIRVHRAAIARLPERPPAVSFGEQQGTAPATAPARVNQTS